MEYTVSSSTLDCQAHHPTVCRARLLPMSQPEHAFCPVYASIDLLQEKWTLHIVRALLVGPHGFNELGRAVGGVNTTTLTARLEHLERIGVVSKVVESTMPPRTRYSLTQAGHELQRVIDAIDGWGQKHMRPEFETPGANTIQAPKRRPGRASEPASTEPA